MKFLYAIILAVVTALPANAQAQITLASPSTPATSDVAFGTPGRTRVQVTFQAPLLSPTEADSWDAARRSIYTQARGECDILSETFKSECHLGSLTFNALPLVGGTVTPPRAVTATAVYELRDLRAR